MKDRFGHARLAFCVVALALPVLAQLPAKPPIAAPYELIREPRFTAAGNATFLKDEDQVVGVSANGVARAYPRRLIAWHHIIHDQLGSTPILATWCNLCATAIVFRNDVDGKKLTPDLAGLRGSNMTFRDRETGTQWQQATGEAFAGPLAGKRLEIAPFQFTTWGEWRKNHPHTQVLLPDPKREAEYEAMAQREARTRTLAKPAAPILREDSRLQAHALVYGLVAGGGQKAYPAARLQGNMVLNEQVGSAPVLVVHSTNGDTTTAFSRAQGGRTLTFRAAQSGEAWLVDDQTGSQWTPYGECVAGRLKGAKLEVIPPLPSFWFAWAEFYPETQVFGN